MAPTSAAREPPREWPDPMKSASQYNRRVRQHTYDPDIGVGIHISDIVIQVLVRLMRLSPGKERKDKIASLTVPTE